MTTPSELQRQWESIAPPARGQLNGRRVPATEGVPPVWTAIDQGGAWHLLVEVPPDTQPLTDRSTRGLHVELAQMVVAEGPAATYIALKCTDSSLRATHCWVAADVVESVNATADVRGAIARTLARWRRFWSVSAGGLSADEALGLFAELWFLDRWLGPELGFTRWAPLGSRHDFQWPRASVEVKGTSVQRQGPATHRIVSLDQLAAPETGDLYLFSLQVVPDTLAANSLAAQVDRVRRALAPLGHEDAFLDRLAGLGYSPAEAERYGQPWRIVAEELYLVDESFPRLTRLSFPNGLPAGVDEVSYSLSLVACTDRRVAVRPTDPAVAGLRA